MSARAPKPPAPKKASAPNKTPAAKTNAPAAKTNAPAAKTKDVAVVRNEKARQLTDPRVIRALAHPVRIALLEALLREGPLTATDAAELLADSPGNMSWHLQTLAKYGYVEEAEGGVGRRRPWRLVSMGTTYDEGFDDPELTAAAITLSQLAQERALDRLQQWYADRAGYSREWQQAWFTSTRLCYLLPDELRQLGDEINALLARYSDRTAHPARRPAGSKAVGIVNYGHPLRPTPSGN
jgi:DNA-binding transcriptional ArsR family regulator